MNVGFDDRQVLSDDGVEQMVELAERLREANGGVLDDSAIQAVAEATGAPIDYVRLAIRLRSEKKKTSFVRKMRAEYLALEPEVRQWVLSGILASLIAFITTLKLMTGDPYGLLGILALVVLTGSLYNVSTSKDSKTATITGAVLGGIYFTASALFSWMLRLDIRMESLSLLPFTFGGALGGLALFQVVNQYRSKLGLKDPVKERQDLLKQLVDLQDKLRSGEQSLTFLSVDIVGSTRMKAAADPLSVEYTFTEYHNFVEMVARKYNGRVHSTAGDGVTCAFEHPQQAFSAARNIQAGILELNTFRNRLGVPLQLRCAVHTGAVVAPQAGDIKSVNFAHVIDIAAHLQKVCPPGGIAVSDAASIYLPGGANSVGTTKVSAMEVGATIWMPRMALDGSGVSALPPIPETS